MRPLSSEDQPGVPEPKDAARGHVLKVQDVHKLGKLCSGEIPK